MSGILMSRTVSISIARPPEAVYDFAADPMNLPRWSFLVTVERRGDAWIVTSADGAVSIRFVERNSLGVLDHVVTVAPGVEVYVPMRVVPNGDGSEVLFTLFQLESMDDEAFDRDTRTVQRDLAKLKTLLEAGRGPGTPRPHSTHATSC